jgi:hypothetical protein
MTKSRLSAKERAARYPSVTRAASSSRTPPSQPRIVGFSHRWLTAVGTRRTSLTGLSREEAKGGPYRLLWAARWQPKGYIISVPL